MTSIASLRSRLLARSFSAINLQQTILPNLGKIRWPMTSSTSAPADTRHFHEMTTPSHFQRLSSLCKVRLPIDPLPKSCLPIPSLPSSLSTVEDSTAPRKATPFPPLGTRVFANSASPSAARRWTRPTGGNNLFMTVRSDDNHRSGAFSSFMPRRSMSVWKGAFVDSFLLRTKKNKERLAGRKIWSRRSSILPEFVDGSVLIYNGKSFVRCKITEGKVGHKFGEFAFTRRRRRLLKANKEKGRKGKK